MIGALDISGSALAAQRTRLDVIAGNMANAQTTAREDGVIAPFQRRFVTFAPSRAHDGGAGVHVSSVEVDDSPPRLVYDPTHPHALPDGPQAGYVQYPNVNPTVEYIDAMQAARSYEANVAMLNITKDMLRQTIQLFA